MPTEWKKSIKPNTHTSIACSFYANYCHLKTLNFANEKIHNISHHDKKICYENQVVYKNY